MQTINSNLEERIINRFRNLNGEQKFHVLHYLENIPKKTHSTKRYRRKAMKQIREALDQQF